MTCVFAQQSDVEYQKNSEYHPLERLDSSDLRIQLAAAKKFLLGPEATVDSPSLNSMLRNRANCVTDTISAYDSRFGSSLNPDWQTKTTLTFQSNSQGSEITELFDHGHFEPYSREDTTFALGQTNKFNIRETSPEWAFSYEITKVNREVFAFLHHNTKCSHLPRLFSPSHLFRSSLLEIFYVIHRIWVGL
jgi:calmodulin-binding transcription activator